jgi:hypothetical protein
VLTPDQLDVVNRDVRAGPAPTTSPTCPVAFRSLRIVGYDAWGDRIMLDGNCEFFDLPTVVFGFGKDEPYWSPSPDVLGMIEGLDYGPWVSSVAP